MELRDRTQLHLDLAWGCLASGRIEQARLQLTKARSLVAGTDVELLRIHCEAIAAWLAFDPAGERQARAAAEAAERLVSRATEAAERQAAAEVACRAWGAVVLILRQDRCQDSIELRRRILALAERHNLPCWVLYERQVVAVEQCWADGDDLPIRELQDEAQRLGHVNLALHLQSSRWAHEVLACAGSLLPTVTALSACAEQARTLGIERVHRYAVAGLLLAAALRADHRAWSAALAQYEVATSVLLKEPVGAAHAWRLALEGRDGEALGTLQDLARWQPTGPHRLAFGLLLLLGTVTGTTSAEQVTQVMVISQVRWTRQFLHWAAAVQAGRRGDRAEAQRQAGLATEAAEIYPVARHLAARLVAPAAAADGWGTPIEDLRAAEAWFHDQGVPVAARTCRDLLRSLGAPIQQRRDGVSAVPVELRAAGLTVREYEVGLLLREHLGNREIGERLHISHRTVEKHLAALYLKLNLPDRRALINRMAESGAR